ncbi:ABC transporter ATP-binding protein [Lepagella muris]|jgi:ABC-2 type transport system ATP-binding protein|uniref:ATP-binding cassette domain-containing protein n=1 Tax=Lepagella muris TaxID=3032870 RepID=A0AC61RJ10_9BACT|nr:ATP-binding cassette domain-containing protein [Lepagella muris]ROT08423.1 ATP-binding cassette domain-containing protein [Muribaculaceae bacterium Isolate-037 (Harlan)]TGY79722.1 ATP-binding cassette domain-containing protein [Lepagella muris]THG51207.1 ATP-binding cassette domain-containing protein [Bacteroidales bacterium]TKC54810.1 ATP-binding cassette domain-containing protein [Bacteroidales bacterium]
MEILQIDGLVKHYASTKALDNVSLSVAKGEICGLLGPNGAGKTTILRIINNLLVSDAGSVLVNGIPASLEASRNIGYMPEERGLYDKMRVEDQILYFGQLKGGDKARLRNVMGEYMEIFNLTGQGKRKIKELSKGNQQKVQIIATLVHEPELVILDEPFSGFDPINGALLRDLIARLNEKGSTIILSSHNMPAIEEMCSSIALINHGKLLVKGDISDIKEQHRTSELLLTTRNQLSIPLLMDSSLLENVETIPPVKGRKGYAYSIIKKPGIRNTDILNAISIQGEILHFEEKLPSLNDIFLNYTTGQPSQEKSNFTHTSC